MDKKQTSDSANSGIGTKRFAPSTRESSASKRSGSSDKNPSGQPNPTGSRGKG